MRSSRATQSPNSLPSHPIPNAGIKIDPGVRVDRNVCEVFLPRESRFKIMASRGRHHIKYILYTLLHLPDINVCTIDVRGSWCVFSVLNSTQNRILGTKDVQGIGVFLF